MTKNPKNRLLLILVIIFSLAVAGKVNPMYSQSQEKDTTFHPYGVIRWVTGGVFVVGIPADIDRVALDYEQIAPDNCKLADIGQGEINPIDRWALKQDPSKMNYYANLSDNTLTGIIFFRLSHYLITISGRTG